MLQTSSRYRSTAPRQSRCEDVLEIRRRTFPVRDRLTPQLDLMFSRARVVLNKLVPENFTCDTPLPGKQLRGLLQTPCELHGAAAAPLFLLRAHHRDGRQREGDLVTDTAEAKQEDGRERKVRVHVRAGHADLQAGRGRRARRRADDTHRGRARVVAPRHGVWCPERLAGGVRLSVHGTIALVGQRTSPPTNRLYPLIVGTNYASRAG